MHELTAYGGNPTTFFGHTLSQTSALVNLALWIICFKNQFNRRQLLVNPMCKSCEAYFDKIHFLAKI